MDAKKSKLSEKVNEEEAKALKIVKKHNTELDDHDMISDVLAKHFFMRILDKRARKEIIREMTLCSVDEGVELYKQGAHGSYFYIVKEGTLQSIVNEKVTGTFTRGESIGESALIHSIPRTETLKAKEKVMVWCMERKNFRKIVDVINKMNYEENKNFISSIRMLSAIDAELKAILSSNLLKQYYEANKVIFKGKNSVF